MDNANRKPTESSIYIRQLPDVQGMGECTIMGEARLCNSTVRPSAAYLQSFHYCYGSLLGKYTKQELSKCSVNRGVYWSRTDGTIVDVHTTVNSTNQNKLTRSKSRYRMGNEQILNNPEVLR